MEVKSRLIVAALAAACVAACGQKGPLYLPDRASDVVTRPAAPQQPPDPQTTSEAPNSPQTVDAPEGPDSPAPEVTAPQPDPAQPPRDDEREEERARDKNQPAPPR